MPTSPLLDRQTALVRALADPKAIAAGAISDMLAGIDPDGLALMSAMSLSKRIEKIGSMMPKTLSLIPHERLERLADDFAAAFPPTSASRTDNARQFLAFLRSVWTKAPPRPPFLPDLAAYELAASELQAAAPSVTEDQPPKGPAVRRNPRIALLRLDHDVRTLAEAELDTPMPAAGRGPVHLALVPSDKGGRPQVFDLAPEIFAIVSETVDWTECDPDDAVFAGLIRPLAERGIVELVP